MRIYRVTFFEDLVSLDIKFDDFSDDDLDIIDELDAIGYYDFINDLGNYNNYLIASESDMKSYIRIIEKNGIKIKVDDFTNKILKMEYSIKDNIPPFRSDDDIDYIFDEDEYLDYGREELWEFFEIELENFILNNLNINAVLDRINDVGINNLTSVEKKYLDNYNN